MARTRDIRPGFFKNEDLSECPPLARLLFAGLWTQADRDGKLEDRPKRLKTEILPYDKCDINEYLNLLASFGFILRYEVDGEKYILIHNFTEHQKVHPKESPSVIPNPSPNLFPEIPELATASPGNSGTGNPFPSSPSLPSKPTLPPTPKGGSAAFEKFWTEYPRKTSKIDARNVWERKKLDSRLPEILRGVEMYRNTTQWQKDNGQFIPHAATFLNKERWLDELNPEGKPVGKKAYWQRVKEAPEVAISLNGDLVRVPGSDLLWNDPGRHFLWNGTTVYPDQVKICESV